MWFEGHLATFSVVRASQITICSLNKTLALSSDLTKGIEIFPCSLKLYGIFQILFHCFPNSLIAYLIYNLIVTL